MKLSYRGAAYNYNPPVLEVTEGEILGKYRGVNWHCHTLEEMPIPQVSHTLTYRGSSYGGRKAEKIIPATIAQTCASKARRLLHIPDTLPAKEIARVHQANLQRNLERRLQSAKQRGDLNLVRLLEAESRALAL
jgi:hypothetical protein